MSSPPKHLNLGCGRVKRPGCLNVDREAFFEPDLEWDLNRRPYPLPRRHFEEIYIHDVIEHLDSVGDFIEEAHELLVPGGLLEITTPHFSCSNSFTDPTHRHHLGCFSFDVYLEPERFSFVSPARFTLESRLLVFRAGPIIGRFARWANRHPTFYEQRLTWIIPAWFLIFRLRARVDEPA
ncbi:MAG TPA: hypothetical protein VF017_22700 [Thermoanaerobaculia bacterium]|nr:hypothetical protein [Thermoanaerobaculia bacterium]